MALFKHVTLLAVRRQLTYRTATLAGLATNFFFGLLRAYVIIALYGARTNVAGLSLSAAITFTGLTQATIAVINLWGWYDLSHTVESGEIATDLLKPMDFFAYWLAQDLGRVLVNLLLRSLPIMLFYVLAFRITTPPSAIDGLYFALSLGLAWLINFSFRFATNLTAFWVVNAAGVIRLATTLSLLLSGFLMPLRFFPAWFQRLCALTPFPAMINTPIEIYLGVRAPAAIVQGLYTQLAWALALVLLSYGLLRLGVRRLVVQGG